MASAVANPAVRAQARGEESAVSVAVGARTAMSCLPLTLATQLGYFKAEGLDVSLIDCFDEAAALRLLASGGAEVASCAFEHTIRSQARGQALQGAAALDGFLRLADQPLFKAGEWGLVVLLSLHLMGGVRLLLIEFGPPSGLRKNWIAAALGFAAASGLAFALALMS